jgi:hypothetical protein
VHSSLHRQTPAVQLARYEETRKSYYELLCLSLSIRPAPAALPQREFEGDKYRSKRSRQSGAHMGINGLSWRVRSNGRAAAYFGSFQPLHIPLSSATTFSSLFLGPLTLRRSHHVDHHIISKATATVCTATASSLFLFPSTRAQTSPVIWHPARRYPPKIMAFSYKELFFGGTTFCCCLPVRVGVIIMTSLGMLLSG